MVMIFVVARVIIAIHVWLYVAAILMSGAWGAYKITWIIRMGPEARKYILYGYMGKTVMALPDAPSCHWVMWTHISVSLVCLSVLQ